MSYGFSEIVFKVSIHWKGHAFISEVHFPRVGSYTQLEMGIAIFFNFPLAVVLLFGAKVWLCFSFWLTSLVLLSVFQSFTSIPYFLSLLLPLHNLCDISFSLPFFSLYRSHSPTCHHLSLIPKCCFPLSTIPVSFPLLSPWCSDGHHGNCQTNGGWLIGLHLTEKEGDSWGKGEHYVERV